MWESVGKSLKGGGESVEVGRKGMHEEVTRTSRVIDYYRFQAPSLGIFYVEELTIDGRTNGNAARQVAYLLV